MHKIRGKSNVDRNISVLCDLKKVLPNYPFYPPANGCCPRGSGFLCDRFSQGEIQCLGEISMDFYLFFLFLFYLPHNNYKKYRKRRKKWRGDLTETIGVYERLGLLELWARAVSHPLKKRRRKVEDGKVYELFSYLLNNLIFSFFLKNYPLQFPK